MVIRNKEINRGIPWLWILVLLFIYGFFHFFRALENGWMPVGDSSNHLKLYAYQYSGFARGEYPIWNPLVKSGEPIYFFQSLWLGNPVSNLVILFSILFKINNIVLSHSLFFFVLVVLYTVGISLLVSVITRHSYAPVISTIFALGSSTVFFQTYQDSFLFITYAIPWIIFSLIQYFKQYQLKYLFLLGLSICAALYSYEVIMGLAFMIFLFISVGIFYLNKIPWEKWNKIPFWHLMIFVIFLVLITIPQLLVFKEMKSGNFAPPLNRIAETKQTSDMNELTYKQKSLRQSEFFIFCENCWTTSFTGSFWGSSYLIPYSLRWTNLKHFIGPMAAPLLLVALFSKKREVWCISFALLLLSLFAGDIFPVNLIYSLPIFDYIRNAYFMNQFMMVGLIVLASIGFDIFITNRSAFNRKIIQVGAGFLIFVCVSFFCVSFYEFLPINNYNHSVLIATIITMTFLSMLTYFGKHISEDQLTTCFLIIAIISSYSINYLIQHNFPILSGGIYDKSELWKYRNRMNHSLHFAKNRPKEIEKWVSDQEVKLSTTYGGDEYYSLATLKDNSFKTIGGGSGLPSFPQLKEYVFFQSVPGHEILFQKKFFYFNKALISTNPLDLNKLKKNTRLLQSMIDNGIGMVNDSLDLQSTTNLGDFKLFDLDKNSNISSANSFSVSVLDYNANSTQFKVTTNTGGLFVYTDLWHKDWNVEINGDPMPLRKIFHTFKGVELQPGVNEVRFIFKNKIGYSLIIMNLIFAFFLITLLLRIFLEKEDSCVMRNSY
ncbi:MAG: hypothetical protein HN474_08230 [Nitrospina sp.]|nr:hypothetical protein [Nitrospina sp.]